ncbi:MAG: hypothetical protein R3194_12125, partial [Limnobacter sp.]|nr:hypothetical protein [Limnobacter sp.]
MSKAGNAYPELPADLAVVTGEASGDWIAALAIAELTKRHSPQSDALSIEGIAGPKLRGAGVHALHQAEEL